MSQEDKSKELSKIEYDSPCGCTARIPEDDPRAEGFKYVMGSYELPLFHPMKYQVEVPEEGETLAYMLNVKSLLTDQRIRLAEFLSDRFNVSFEETVDLIVKQQNESVPIVAKNLTVTWCNEHSRRILMSAMGDELPDHGDIYSDRELEEEGDEYKR